MKKLSVFLCTAAFAAIGFASQAQAAGINLYNAHEFDLDVFGTRVFANSDSARLFNEDANGGGVALNYFLTEMVGVGGELTFLESRGDTTVITTAGATFRLPVGSSGISLQGIAGLGVLFNPNELDLDDGKNYGDQEDAVFMGYLGGGAEWRFNEGFAAFADYRYNFVDQSDSNFGQARLGLRFAW